MTLKETKCKICGSKESPIYLMPNPKDKNSYWCKKCRDKEVLK